MPEVERRRLNLCAYVAFALACLSVFSATAGGGQSCVLPLALSSTVGLYRFSVARQRWNGHVFTFAALALSLLAPFSWSLLRALIPT